ncbi:hypothetical protein Tco_0468783 [Tanacetum coccineum]
MTTLAEFMIIVSADNRPPMLEKSLYDSWKSHMRTYTTGNRENGRMILNSVQNGPLVWPTIVEEDGTTRKNKYEELLVAKNSKPTVILKLPTSFFKVFHRSCVMPLVNHHKLPKEIFWDQSFVVLVFTQGDDLIACLNKAMAFLTVVASSRFPSTNNQLSFPLIRETRPPFKTQGEGHMARQCTQPKKTMNAASFKEKIDLNVHIQSILYFLRFRINPESSRSDLCGDRSAPTPGKELVILPSTHCSHHDKVEFFEGWKPLSPLQLVMEEVMSE